LTKHAYKIFSIYSLLTDTEIQRTDTEMYKYRYVYTIEIKRYVTLFRVIGNRQTRWWHGIIMFHRWVVLFFYKIITI